MSVSINEVGNLVEVIQQTNALLCLLIGVVLGGFVGCQLFKMFDL